MHILNVVENYLSLENIIKILIDSILPSVYKMSLEHLVTPQSRELSKTIGLVSNDPGANLMRITLNRDDAVGVAIKIITAKGLDTYIF